MPQPVTTQSYTSWTVALIAIIGLSLFSIAIVVTLSLIPLYLPTRTIDTISTSLICKANPADERIQILPASRQRHSQKIRINCPIIVLGAGAGGAHTAYRLAPTHENQICVFERNDYVGGRAYDRGYDGSSPDAYSPTLISAQGSLRFYDDQSVMKRLAEELQIAAPAFKTQKTLYTTRGQFYTSINEMCSRSYTNLTCTNDTEGLDPRQQLWKRMLTVFRSNPSDTYRFGNFFSYALTTIGDEAIAFLRDSQRFRDYYNSISAYSFLEYYEQEVRLKGLVYYPVEGMSQFPKRMLFNAVKRHGVKLYLNEEVLSIDDAGDGQCYPFSIETTRYSIRANQLVAAIDPLGWTTVVGSVAKDMQNSDYSRSLLTVKLFTVQAYWPRRWWEESVASGPDVYEIMTRQDCLVFLEITSQRPEQKIQNQTKMVYDGSQCLQSLFTLASQPSQEGLIAEILRDIRGAFPDVAVPLPTKVFPKIWKGGRFFIKANSTYTSSDITRWALNPLKRFNRNQFSLVGEAFFPIRTAWTESAIKSSLVSLTSQFGFNFDCFQNDSPAGGRFCPSDSL